MNILFIDAKCSENYDFKYMESHSLGGTESTVLRLARELAREHNVHISQINRTEPYFENGINFIHRDTSLTPNKLTPDIIIIIRKYKLVKDYSLLYPQAKMFVWSHNFSNYEILGRRHRIVKTNAQVICVSQCHQNHINKIFNGYFSWLFRFLSLKFKKIPITFIYNTIDSDFTKYNGQVDSNKLIFLSSPNKGLKEVLLHFKNLLEKAPNYKLYIAGASEEQLEEHHLDNNLLQSDSVVLLGKLSKDEIVSHLQNSFCVFYPQHVHPETFGLIYVEANCVGTPVLAHSFGSTSEVIENQEQIVDARSSEAVVDKILNWQQNGRPEVSCQEKFRISNVVLKWKEVLKLN
ncbi:MAG: glycosyltransferase family 4 protein [Woeseiaceae bacterium]